MSAATSLIDDLGTSRRGLVAFAGFGLLDGSFLPWPIEPFVLPVMAANPRRAPVLALSLLAGCLLGTFLFYLIGLGAGDALVEPLLRLLGLKEAFAEQIGAIRDNAFVTLFVIGFTPIPLQIGTLGAGVAGADPFTFLAAMALARGARFAILAAAAMAIGTQARPLFERFQRRIVWGSVGLLIVFFLGIRFL
jgi:membrane protein YqaA with SNARE-associated domain